MVDLVARIVADDNERVLSFKTSEVIFGGGRLTVHNKEIPLDYGAFGKVYEEANQKAVGAMKHGGNTPATPAPRNHRHGHHSAQQKGQKGQAENPTETPVDAPEPVTENADNAPLSSDANCPSEDVEEPAPKMDVNPPRRTRKKREE